MNTLVHPTPPPAAAGARPLPAIDLPSGPPPLHAAPAPVQADEAAPRKTGLLTWLLAGTAVAGVLGMIGAGLVATLSRAGHSIAAPADWLGMPQAVSPQQSPVQPSQAVPAQAPPRNAPASIGTKNPFEPAGSPSAVSAVVPAPTPVPAPAPRSSGDELRALKQSGPYARPAPSRPAAAAAASAVQDAPASPLAAGQQEPKAAPAAGSAADPARAAGAPTIDLAAAAAPQSLVDMVAALADDIAQERRSDAELRKQIATLLHDTDQRLSDFDRRLTVAEAGVVPAIARVGFGRASARSAPAGVLSAMRTVLAVPPPGARPYEIRAASPGVAVLGTLDGTPAVVEIAVGDQVPGYGRVNAIAQKGSAWAVQCEHGTIQ